MRMRYRPKKTVMVLTPEQEKSLDPSLDQSRIIVCRTWEEALEHFPLQAFSPFLAGRVDALEAIADEIVENLDDADWDLVDLGGEVARAEGLTWLWTLGAYEVIRTMCQARRCFSRRANDALTALKKALSEIRMPAAKMECPGIKAPVTSNRNPVGFDHVNCDLLLYTADNPQGVSTRTILTEFDRVLSDISKKDVLDRHENSYRSGA